MKKLIVMSKEDYVVKFRDKTYTELINFCVLNIIIILSGAHSKSKDVAVGPEGDDGMNLTPMKRICHIKL